MHNRAEVEDPCKVPWNSMQGNEKVRHCSKCRFNVYNFAEMTQAEIDELLSSGNRVCGRLFVRPDGTYLTKSCKAKFKRRRRLAAVALIITVPLTFVLLKGDNLQDSPFVNKLRSVPVMGKVVNWVIPPRPVEIAGIICAPIPPVKKAQNTGSKTPQGGNNAE